jgi:hypothetical protein
MVNCRSEFKTLISRPDSKRYGVIPSLSSGGISSSGAIFSSWNVRTLYIT